MSFYLIFQKNCIDEPKPLHKIACSDDEKNKIIIGKENLYYIFNTTEQNFNSVSFREKTFTLSNNSQINEVVLNNELYNRDAFVNVFLNPIIEQLTYFLENQENQWPEYCAKWRVWYNFLKSIKVQDLPANNLQCIEKQFINNNPLSQQQLP